MEKITIVFENTDYIDIPYKFVNELRFVDVKKAMGIIKQGESKHYQFDMNFAESTIIDLNVECLDQFVSGLSVDIKLKERLKDNDITSVSYREKDGSDILVYVKFNEVDMYTNKYQRLVNGNNNNVTILINEQKEKDS